MALSQEQIDFFHENGYLSYGKLLEREEVERLQCEYDRVFEESWQEGGSRNLSIDSTGDMEAMRNAPEQMWQIVQVCERSLPFLRLVYDERILDIVEDLLGPNLMLFHDQALFKPAHTGGPVFWHQDNAYWKCAPANLVSCWMTLDDADVANGAMHVLPGSHLRPARHDSSESTNILLKQKDVDESQAQAVELPAGGCMFHHCQTLHATPPNRTNRPRRAFVIHFMTPGTRRVGGDTIPVGFQHPMLRMRI